MESHQRRRRRIATSFVNDAAMSLEDRRLFAAAANDDADAAAIVQRAIQNGANVNAVCNDRIPLMLACERGNDQIVGILLGAGADARWKNKYGGSAIYHACMQGHLSTVQLLIIHDNSLREMADNFGWTPLFRAICQQHSDLVRFLLDSGADRHHVNLLGQTALMTACDGEDNNLEILRLLLHTDVDVEARDYNQQTALHYAASRGTIELVRELIVQHNANMFAQDIDGRTPFDLACGWDSANIDHLLEIYGNKLTQDHGRLALHELLKVAQYSFVEDKWFHPPLNPFRIILPLGKLRLEHFRTLLHAMNLELIRNRDDTGKFPIHIACSRKAPVDVLALILELDPTALHIADNAGALPVHLLCGSGTTEYASLRYLVEQGGGVGTLAARNHEGALPLHALSGSTNPSLRTVQYLMQSFPGSVAMRTNDGQYPFMVVATDSSSASLSVVYELVRANPGLVVPE